MTSEAITKLARGKINPLEAAAMLNEELCGITRVVWNPGANKYTIYNHTRQEHLPVIGARKKVARKLQELAALAYGIAQRNGFWEAGEVHLSKEVSSKHHEFKIYLGGLRAQYSPI